MREETFETLELLQAAVERLHTEGWDVTPWDDVDKGMRGFACVRQGSPVERVLLKLWTYGRELVPEYHRFTEWTEFVDALTQRLDEDMERSTDFDGESAESVTCEVGFVCYGRAESEGKSDVFRIGARALQAGGEVARATLMAILLKSQKQRALERGGGGS